MTKASKGPPSNVCPERYCFFWLEPGGSADISARVYSSLDEALNEGVFTPFPEGGCRCRFGVCTRLRGATGQRVHQPGLRRPVPARDVRDWYEPCEPALERDGLPHDYFKPNAKDA